MVETTLRNITDAAADADLIARMTSAAAASGIPNPDAWVTTNARRVVAEPVTGAGDTVASVYAYAVATYDPPPRPGVNEAGATDQFIRDAVAAVYAAQTA